MSEPAASDVWRNDTQADFLVFQLVRLAGAAMLEHFNEDEPQPAYASWLRAEKRRKGGGKPKLLEKWHEHPECGTLSLTALPEDNTFMLALAHEAFAAEVVLRYNLEREEIEGANVRHFHGEVALAVQGANNWFDEFSISDALDFDDLDMSRDDLDEIFRGVTTPDDGEDDEDEDDGEPPDITRKERLRLGKIARTLLQRPRGDQPPELQDSDQTWLAMTPQALLPMLEEAIAIAAATPPNHRSFVAWLVMLNYQLEQIRYQSERGRQWAEDMLDAYQQRLRQAASQREIGHSELFDLVAALGHAKVPVDPALSEAMMESAPGGPAVMPSGQGLQDALRPLIEQMAQSVASPFDLIEALNEGAAVVPGDVRSFMAIELALSPYPVTRDAVPLMLLDKDAEVRRSAAQALEQTADTLSPEALRRSIALRNWLPEADRAPLDQAIRKARAKGLQPAQWDKPLDVACRASAEDGSGAQSLLFVSRAGKTGFFGGLLLKQGFGVRDAWCSRDVPRREIGSALSDVQRKMALPEVERDFIDLAVQHAIANGVAADNLPDPALLGIAEAVGGSDWKDRQLDVPGETGRLFGGLPAEQRTQAAIAASLQRIRTWMGSNALADSWFEDDAEVRAVQQGPQADARAAVLRLLDGPLTERRAAWAERFLMTALCARAVKPGQPPLLGNPGKGGVTWQDLVLLAHVLQSDAALQGNPVMVHIAERTFATARALKW